MVVVAGADPTAAADLEESGELPWNRLHWRIMRASAGAHPPPWCPWQLPGGADATPATVVQTLRWRWVVYQMLGAWLFAGPLSVLGTAYGIMSMVGQDPSRWIGRFFEDFVARVPWTTWLLTSLLVVAVTGMAAGALTFTEAWWRYRLVHEPGDRFVATRGLLTTRSFTADRERLRGATLRESLTMRALGGARLAPIMTGVSLQQEMSESAALLPATTRDVATRVANVLLGGNLRDEGLDGSRGWLHQHPRAARRRAVLRYGAGIAIAAAALAAAVRLWVWPGWLLLVPVALLPLAVAAGFGYYRNLGHRLEGEYLYLRRGVVTRRTDALQVRGINGAAVRQTVFQRRLGLATLTLATAAGEQGYQAVDLALEEATALAAVLVDEPSVALRRAEVRERDLTA